MPRFRDSLLLTLVLALGPLPAAAQDGDDGLVDIEVGSRRTGGPGITRAERRQTEWESEPEEWLTEENLPAKGHKKRLPGLHVLAKRSAGGKLWQEACDRYDQIIEEGGEAAMDLDPDAKKNARDSYLGCAESEFAKSNFDKAEALLKKSEKWGPSSHRHTALRNKMAREEYHQVLLNSGDVDKAVALFDAYFQKSNDDDERIWMGNQLAERAWDAYRNKDETALKRLRGHLDKIAPQNTEYRKLKEDIDTAENIIPRVLGFSFAAILGVVVMRSLFRANARRKIEAATGGKLGGKSKNKYLLDDD